jgi:hypothetical protein
MNEGNNLPLANGLDSGIILKIDFEKAYDKVKWPFVQQTLRMKDFSSKWCS